MIALVACSALLLLADAPPSTDVRDQYAAARASAGRTPDDQVRLALWCEAHGLSAERLKHLALAILADPSHPTARGLMGLVARDGRWLRPDAVAARVGADPVAAATLAEYDGRRQKAAYTADGQWALGLWCDEHGLTEQARAHLTAVVRLDPTRENAWKRLGYQKHEGRWTTDAQVAAEHANREAQRVADHHWKPTLERLKKAVGLPSKRDEALAELATMTDPRAVPSIARVFLTDYQADRTLGIQLLGQIETPASSRMLASIAVFSPSGETRRLAIETLKRRDARDFVRSWIALIRKPIKFEVKPVGGPGSPGELFVEGEKANLKRLYKPKPMQFVPNARDTTLEYDANGLPVLVQYLGRETTGRIRSLAPSPFGGLAMPTGGAGRNNDIQIIENRIPVGLMALEAQKSFLDARQKLAADVAMLERNNADASRANEPVLLALREVTGGNHGDDPAAWARWWVDQEGYALAITSTRAVPTIVEEAPVYSPAILPGPVTSPPAHGACFGAGTLVRAIDGPRPIETLRVGDLVLAQDTKSGALSYQPVVTPYHNPPSSTLRINLGEETIVATGIHRFWKAGKGWTMARDLKVGDPVRLLGGIVSVTSVEADRVQPVFNLEVATGHSFFVGKTGALVHDNTTVEPTPVPFDAPANLAVATGTGAK